MTVFVVGLLFRGVPCELTLTPPPLPPYLPTYFLRYLFSQLRTFAYLFQHFLPLHRTTYPYPCPCLAGALHCDTDIPTDAHMPNLLPPVAAYRAARALPLPPPPHTTHMQHATVVDCWLDYFSAPSRRTLPPSAGPGFVLR